MKKIIPLLLIIYACSNPKVEKIYYNGVIWTGDLSHPSATALAVGDEQILFVGDDKEVLALATEETEKINLKGRFVTPGLIDNHVHFMSGGFQLSNVDLRDVNNKA